MFLELKKSRRFLIRRSSKNIGLVLKWSRNGFEKVPSGDPEVQKWWNNFLNILYWISLELVSLSSIDTGLKPFYGLLWWSVTVIIICDLEMVTLLEI